MMDKREQNFDVYESFLNEVTDQIAFKPIRASIRQELEEHLLDRIEEYEEQGISQEEAKKKAVQEMGDAVRIGSELNEIHSIRSISISQIIVSCLLVIGFMFTNFMQWNPEQDANGSYFYLVGILFFLLVSWKGYPVFIKNWKRWTLMFMVGSVLVVIASKQVLFPMGIPSVQYCLILFSASLVITAIYYIPNRMSRLQCVTIVLGLVLSVALICTSHYVSPTVKLIFGLSLFGTLFFMVDRDIILGKKIKLYMVTTFCTLLFGITIFADQNHDTWLKTFLVPEKAVESIWDDAYNGILIQELLSETPWIGGLELSQEELLDYRTGAWYFAERDEKQIGMIIPQNETELERLARKEHVKELHEEGILVKYIYETSEVELWDVLPQHYHNNYIFAVTMFMFGRLPGMLLILAFGGLLYLLTKCVLNIQGRLASALSFCYLQCIVWQCVFYVLGNFGYQYGSFPNMPMLSEGRISIFLNMFMVGMILSAYRYDHVLGEKNTTRIFSI